MEQSDLQAIVRLLADKSKGDPKPAPKIDNNVRQAWNDYVNWLDSKGLKGSPTLDHNDLGGQMIDEYRKENPNTPITRDMIVPIQKEFQNYRNWAINQIETGHGAYAPGTNKDNFLRALSIVDGIPGQRTTSFSFPSQYLNTFNNGQLVDTKKDFATMQ